DCARKADTRLARRTGLVVSGVARELATQISPLLRLVLVAGIVGVVALGGRLWITSVRLEQRIAAQTVRIRGLSALLDRAERDRITVNDLEARRDELEKRMSRTVSRLDALEARGEARERVIAAASGSVAFLQGGYGFEEEASHRRLRYVLDAGGAPQTGPDGSPLLTFDGDGTEVEILFTGTGFAVGEGRRLITNRHVAVPWEFDSSTQAIVAQGLTPVMNRMIGFLPHRAEPFDVRLLRTSDSADLALLAIAPDHPAVAPLVLSDAPPHVGDEVLVLGFPAGVQALIARADPVFVTGLMERGPPGFWDVTRDLAKEGYIAPLATMGIIGQITRTRVVYDADTTHGGSGGPVLSMDGTVLAVNSAIIPDFGGSNLGVPAREAHALLDVAADARP
ncbi:MAG: trypsin-like peptidase domain-containing protein, partial [Acidobacteriota bacterium]